MKKYTPEKLFLFVLALLVSVISFSQTTCTGTFTRSQMVSKWGNNTVPVRLDVCKTFNSFSLTSENKWTLSGNNIYNNNSGFVGIGTGTVTPTNLLQVAGLINFDDANDNTKLGVGAIRLGVSSSTGVGKYAGYNNTGYSNVIIGQQAMFSSDDASISIAIGYNALRNNTNDECLVIGHYGMVSMTNSYQDIAIGNGTFTNGVDGDYNVLVGVDIFGQTRKAKRNTIVGTRGGLNSDSINDCVFLGYQAGIHETMSGRVYIGSSTASTQFEARRKILFYGVQGADSSTSTGQLNGKLKINDGTQANGKVLTSDANGVATWANQMLTASDTLDFPSTLAQTASDLTITVTGASLGDVVALGIPEGSVQASSCYTVRVSATNTVTVRFNCYGLVAKDPAPGTFSVRVFK